MRRNAQCFEPGHFAALQPVSTGPRADRNDFELVHTNPPTGHPKPSCGRVTAISKCKTVLLCGVTAPSINRPGNMP
jgi:hypothetical protein